MICPLNSLMKDQQHTLEQRGVKVASTYNLAYVEKIEKIKQGYYEIIYILVLKLYSLIAIGEICFYHPFIRKIWLHW